MAEIKKGFGRRNVHCSNCGDERGGPFGHEISECRYRSGMTAEELAATMPEEKAVRYWGELVDRYFDTHLAQPVEQPEQGVCNCESYEPCHGECCGPGNCSCSLPAEQPEGGVR